MAITANDQYLLPSGGSRISRAGFARLLRQLANTAVLAEADANTFFDIIISTKDEQGRNPDPLFVLAMFNHESNMGRAGVAVSSKSWGNTRTPNFGAVPIGSMPGLSGTFPVWASWQDGLRSTCARLTTKDWYYAFEQRTIGEVFRDPHYPNRNPNKPMRVPIPRVENQPIEWAPAGDLNNPAAYLASMLNFMNEHADMEGDQPVGKYPKPAMTNYPSPNRDGYSTPRKIELIVNHIGQATKASNLAWLTNPASRASCNAYIDRQGKIYELVPIWSSPWTNGQVKSPDMSNPIIAAIVNAGINPNTRCYTIEHEGDTGDDLTPAQIKANNELTSWVSSEAGFEISRNTVVGHYQFDNVDRWYCPSFTDAEWEQLVSGARRLLDPSEPPPADIPKRCFPDVDGIDSCIVWGFKGYWERLEDLGLAYQEYGYPHTNEFRTKVDGVERTVQLFQRGGLAWYPESAGTEWEYRRLTRGELWSAVEDARKQGVLRQFS